MLVLALTDAATISLWAVNLLVSIAMAIVLYRVAAVTKKFERQEDRSDASLKTAETKLHDAATKLIDERFRAMSHEMNGHVHGFVNTLDELKERLSDSDGIFRNLGDADHQNELKTQQRMEQIKDYVRDHCASRGDVREHVQSVNGRIDTMGAKVDSLSREVAVLGTKLERVN